jgi:hypothetical protein
MQKPQLPIHASFIARTPISFSLFPPSHLKPLAIPLSTSNFSLAGTSWKPIFPSPCSSALIVP